MRQIFEIEKDLKSKYEEILAREEVFWKQK
jgi:hypothetical protein